MSRTIENGTRVRVLTTHWNATRHGASGRTVSTTTAADGDLPTHWVTFDDGGGEFVLADDLADIPLIRVCAWCPGFDPRAATAHAGDTTHGMCPDCEARMIARVDAAELLQTFPVSVLVASARRAIDLTLMSRHELAKRGRDLSGAWVGFDRAAQAMKEAC